MGQIGGTKGTRLDGGMNPVVVLECPICGQSVEVELFSEEGVEWSVKDGDILDAICPSCQRFGFDFSMYNLSFDRCDIEVIGG